MRVTRTRANAVTVVATRQELSALVSGARMAHALMSADPGAPPEAQALADLLARVLADFDAGLARAREET